MLVWGLGGVHNDFLMVLCLVFGYYLLLRDPRPAAAIGRAATARSAGGGRGATRRRRRAGMPLARAGCCCRCPRYRSGAGAAFALGTSIKASGGIVIPIVLAALLRRPRALVQVLIGMVVARRRARGREPAAPSACTYPT